MNATVRARIFVYALLVSLVAVYAFAQEADKPLTNTDVIALVRAGLDSDLIVAKIFQAPLVQLDVSPNELVRLNANKIPKPVINAMIDRMNRNSTRQTSSGIPPQVQQMMQSAIGVPLRVELVSGGEKREVTPKEGRRSTTYVVFGILNWLNIDGTSADVRVSKGGEPPVIRVFCDCDITKQPVGVARVEVNDSDRSVKLTSSKIWSADSFMSAAIDEDWLVTRAFSQTSPGVYDAVLKKPLKKGEYVVVNLQTNQMFDFGID